MRVNATSAMNMHLINIFFFTDLYFNKSQFKVVVYFVPFYYFVFLLKVMQFVQCGQTMRSKVHKKENV